MTTTEFTIRGVHPRTIIIAVGAAWELTAILTRRIPTISEVWAHHRTTAGRHFFHWVTGWTIYHLWHEPTNAR